MSEPITLSPVVFDCHSGNDITDWAAVKGAGILGIIHKATEGRDYTDKTYAARRPRILKAGLLHGAYHFLRTTDIEQQAAHFLETAQPDVNTLLALDWERAPNQTRATAEQARRFLEIVFAKTGQRPVLYGGDVIKELVPGRDPFFGQHRLWLCHYLVGDRPPVLPKSWDGYWLWQFTGDSLGNFPHVLPGVANKGLDLNVFGGEDLASEWAPKGTVAIPNIVTSSAQTPPSEVAASAAAALIPQGGGELQDKSSFWDRFNFKVLDELAEKGSRTATSLKAFKGVIWKGAATTVTTGGAAATLVDPNKGTAQVVGSWGSQHPFLLAALCAGVVAIVLIGVAYYYAKRIEKGLAAAAKDGRYAPRGA